MTNKNIKILKINKINTTKNFVIFCQNQKCRIFFDKKHK